MSEAKPNIHEALAAVMNDVQAIGKNDRNAQQGFQFRGVDAVINKVGPIMRKHNVLITPMVEERSHETVPTKNGGTMRNTTVRVRFRFTGPDGSFLDSVVYGEAADSGDKSVSKAQSVAYRTVLIQQLCIPTNEPDPDQTTFERAAAMQSSGRNWEKEVADARDADTVRNLYREAAAFRELDEELRDVMQQRVSELTPQQDKEPATVGS